MMPLKRAMEERIRRRSRSKLGRLLVLTGARQVGKTTLVRESFPDVPYLSLEDPALRPEFTRLSALDWVRRYPRAILDEVQKAPSLIETVKAAYDLDSDVRYVLLGSSQILLLDRVRESLAGRAALEELWPLTLPEMEAGQGPVAESRLLRWLRGAHDGWEAIPAATPSFAVYDAHFERYLAFGGMPVVHDPALTDEERESWLRDYRRTYLERDVADLANLRDLEPFTRAQKVIALNSGQLVNYADLARSAGVSPDTARRFMRYLELSYQVLVLPPWFRNAGKRLVKAPKVHFLDPGVQRATSGRRGEIDGPGFESAVVVEIVKQLRTAAVSADAYHLRTHDGREVDLLLELPDGYVAFELKLTHHVGAVDARHLVDLGPVLDKPLLGAFVLSRDRTVRELAPGVWAMPASWLLAP